MSPQKKKKFEAALDNLFSSPRSKPKTGSVEESLAPEVQSSTIQGDQPVVEAVLEVSPVEFEPRSSYPLDADTDKPLPLAHEILPVEAAVDLQGKQPASESTVLEKSPTAQVALELAPAEPKIVHQEAASMTSSPQAPLPAIQEPVRVEAAPVREPEPETAPQAETHSSDLQLVVFTLEGQYYGVGISIVESIIKMQNITLVPHARHYIKGVTNLRGRVLPVIDLRSRFGLSPMAMTKDNRIIVINMKKIEVGMIVDAVSEVLTIQESCVEPTPQIATSMDSDYITGVAKVNDHLVIMLDVAKILAIQELEKEI